MGGTGIYDDFTLGLNWYWNPNMHMEFNYTRAYRSSDGPTANLSSGIADIWAALPPLGLLIMKSWARLRHLVSDRSLGFDPAAATNHSGSSSGVLIRARLTIARLLGGRIRPGNGTPMDAGPKRPRKAGQGRQAKRRQSRG